MPVMTLGQHLSEVGEVESGPLKLDKYLIQLDGLQAGGRWTDTTTLVPGHALSVALQLVQGFLHGPKPKTEKRKNEGNKNGH